VIFDSKTVFDLQIGQRAAAFPKTAKQFSVEFVLGEEATGSMLTFS
jgi:hypothetical protein